MTFYKKTVSMFAILILLGLYSKIVWSVSSTEDKAVAYQQKNSSKAAETQFHILVSSYQLEDIKSALGWLDKHWQKAFSAPLIEMLSLRLNSAVAEEVVALLERKTGQELGDNAQNWYFWLWNEEEEIGSYYANFKASVYKQIDTVFDEYFYERQNQARIRLDEIRWGGVAQDGIPPLRYPKMLSAKNADYLENDNVVFGIEINGDARAYPKRILAWHEMFVDTIGGTEIAGVYCTLCGTVIPYKTTINGTRYELGTSGFLYRSNKLMYDKKTQSLWSTVRGTPVLGPLVDKGIVLEHIGMVTTTWGEWKRRHPNTTVLSLETGHNRNYGEGVAYNAYFSTDQLMFNTPFSDTRLKNKQEVLALRFFASPKDQLAIDTDFLKNNPLYTNKIGQQKILVLTDSTGANRVYDPKNVTFVSYDQDSALVDSKGGEWLLEEGQLVARQNGQTLTSLPYRRAFWFGWHAAFPDTQLIY
ncbi:DUF3179 domain-containing protein [Marinomonas sp.]|nr:DUF3179 domain-containing protein [Marinomonas sp.]MDB4838047.1 DUF3179 domain-containing protein [Marinomonas sp.]